MSTPVVRRKQAAATGGAIALILSGIYAVEGGYVRNATDPGGQTRWGVTMQTARAAGYTGDMRLFPQRCVGSVKVCADSIYVPQYVVAPGYMPLVSVEPAVADKLVDTAVNMGPARPNTWYRLTLGRGSSGAPLTQADVAAYVASEARTGRAATCANMLVSLATRQEQEYLRLVRQRPSLGAFERGWVARARNLHPSGLECGR